MVRNQLAMRFIQTEGGVHLYVRTRKLLFRISGTAGRTALKCGMWERGPPAMCFAQAMDRVSISARAHPFPVFRERLDALR